MIELITNTVGFDAEFTADGNSGMINNQLLRTRNPPISTKWLSVMRFLFYVIRRPSI